MYKVECYVLDDQLHSHEDPLEKLGNLVPVFVLDITVSTTDKQVIGC